MSADVYSGEIRFVIITAIEEGMEASFPTRMSMRAFLDYLVSGHEVVLVEAFVLAHGHDPIEGLNLEQLRGDVERLGDDAFSLTICLREPNVTFNWVADAADLDVEGPMLTLICGHLAACELSELLSGVGTPEVADNRKELVALAEELQQLE